MTSRQKEWLAGEMAKATVTSIFEHFGPHQRGEARELLDLLMRNLQKVIEADDLMNRAERAGMQ